MIRSVGAATLAAMTIPYTGSLFAPRPGMPAEAIIRPFLQHAPVDLAGMVAALGMGLRLQARLAKGTWGQISREIRGGREIFTIEISARCPPAARRYTLAHELAHALLHRSMFEDDAEYEAYQGRAHKRMERQADRFAADLVMPAPLVRKEFRADPSLAHLVRTFDVSEAAMRIRLEELGLG